MKLAFFSDCWEPQVNGVIIAVKNLREALKPLGYETTVFAPAIRLQWQDSTADHKQLAVRYPFQREFAMGFPWPYQALSLARQKRFSLIHAHTEFSLGLIADKVAKRLKIPLVFTLHTLWKYYVHYVFWGLLPYNLLAFAMRSFYKRPDYFIVPSSRVKSYLQNEFNVTAPITVIPTGLDLDKFFSFKLELPEKISFLKQYGFKETDKLMLFVGRLGKEKSIEFLLRALARLSLELPELKLLIVGDGPQRKELEKLTAALGLKTKVAFTGYLAQAILPLVYKAADYFVLASRTESQGLVTVEALASGLPVIVADDEVNLEIVGEELKKYSFTDEKSFCSQILNISKNKNLKALLASFSLKRANFFTLQSYAQRMDEYYRWVLKDFKSR